MDFSIWVAAFWQGVVFVVAMYAVVSITWGASLARWACYPLWLGVTLGLLVPVLGPAVAAIVARSRRGRAVRIRRRSWRGRWESLLLLLPVAGLLFSLVVPWWRLELADTPDVLVYPGGHLLDVLVIISVVFYAVAFAVFLGRDLAHLSAILLIAPVAFWAGFLWLVFAVTDATQRTLGGVAAMRFTVGDALELFGVDLGPIVVPGVTDADVTDLAERVHLGVGDGWWVMAAVTGISVVWMLRQAFRRVVVVGPPVAPVSDHGVGPELPTMGMPQEPGFPWVPPVSTGEQSPWSIPPSDPTFPPVR